ncbi:MAG: hypothetical protein FDZ70_10155, partial [Actinobacteria bacterium]
MLTIAVVAGSLLVVGSAALTGVYGYTRRLADARIVEHRRLIKTQFDSAALYATQAVGRAAVSRTGAVDPASLAVDYATSSQGLNRLVVIGAAGDVRASFPEGTREPVPPEVIAHAQ